MMKKSRGIFERIELKLASTLKVAKLSPAPPKLAASIDYAIFPGGARVRPQLCLSVAQACGDDCPEISDAAAAAIELIHCASLVHDDLPCFDDSDLRRGKPTVHRAFGEPVAVLAGDTLIILAYETLALSCVQNPKRLSGLIRLLSRSSGMPFGICAGQGWESEDSINVTAYHKLKTGSLFVAATCMGALAAGEDPDPWMELGARIGEAFQVADDLQDVLLKVEEIGKPAGQDLLNSRPNVVHELGVDGAVSKLQDILGGAIASIPSCPGEAELCEIVRQQAKRLTPSFAIDKV
jgi:geranylgeranyl diphosphate synthase type II